MKAIRNIGWVSLVSLTVSTAFVTSSCGKLPRGKRGANDSASSGLADSAATPLQHELASSIRLRIIPGSERFANLPELSASGDQNYLSDGLSVHFRDAVDLSNPEVRPYYLAWNGRVSGLETIDAYYSYLKSDPDNQSRSDFEHTPVSYDRDHGVWFIPLAKALGDTAETITPGDKQVLRVFLNIGAKLPVILEISFHAKGRMIAVNHAIKRRFSGEFEASEVGHLQEEGGFPLLEEELINPGAVSQRLWLRANSEIELLTGIQVPQYRDTGKRKDRGCDLGRDIELKVIWERYYSKVKLEGLRVELTRIREGHELQSRLNLVANSWVPIEILPFEKLRIRWFAAPGRGVTVCALPSPRHREFTWTYGHRSKEACALASGPLRLKFALPVQAEMRQIEEWTTTGKRLLGTWSRSLKLGGAPGDATTVEARDLVSETVYLSGATEKSAEWNSTWIPFPCQGVF